MFRTAHYWFIGVPFAAKTILYLESKGSAFAQWSGLAAIQLPFSRQALFYASMFLFIANVIFYLRCPAIIRNFSDFTQFHSEGRGEYQIMSELRSSIMSGTWRAQRTATDQHSEAQKKAIDNATNTVDSFRKQYCNESEADVPNTLSLPQKLSKLTIKADSLNGAFWSARDYADLANPIGRIAAAINYLFGIVFVLIVIGQNIIAVYKLTTFQELFQS